MSAEPQLLFQEKEQLRLKLTESDDKVTNLNEDLETVEGKIAETCAIRNKKIVISNPRPNYNPK